VLHTWNNTDYGGRGVRTMKVSVTALIKTVTNAVCSSSPTLPAPTPQSGYRCNGLTGQCVADGAGTHSAAGCIASCTVKYSCDTFKGQCAGPVRR
jgi:hypothetical protein